MTVFRELIGVERFARGLLTYSDRFRTEPTARIVLPVTFEQTVHTSAILDTGAPWCILNPEEAVNLDLDRRADCVEAPRLLIRGSWHSGTLCRLSVSLFADIGDSLTLEASVFIPNLTNGESWLHPNFLGLDGFLDRFRFALDPEHNHFYFGPLSSE